MRCTASQRASPLEKTIGGQALSVVTPKQAGAKSEFHFHHCPSLDATADP
ncbi:MAG TPA: hypothetical protein VMD99_12180 [Terriglobales bacterium]|nr:hypothetical protein [Terriglobales bacterium]